MRPKFTKFFSTVFVLMVVGACTSMFGQTAPKVDTKKMAEAVKAEFLHAWNGYKKHCWGHDDLKPISKTCRDWYGQSILMTPVDSLDSLYLLGFKKEADETREYIVKNLSFDKDISVQNFEITIRILGGLLSSYQMTNDKRLLNLADDLGNRLLPVFDSPTGLPYKNVNLRTGKTSGAVSNPAETGTLLIEFGTLAKLTGKQVYYDKAKRALVETYKRRSPIGLVGTNINVETGKWTNPDSHVSAEIDSYYEYLLKAAILFNDKECRDMWEDSIAKVHSYLADEGPGMSKPNVQGREVASDLWYGHADMNTGKRTETTTGALDAFFPGLLALDGDLNRARALQDSMFKMWQLHGIEPEVLNYRTMKVESGGYPLRPEIVESTYILHHYTKDPKYLAMGKQMFEDFVKHCRTDVAYAGLKNVETKEKTDYMHSFLLAETFKYFYLLFAPEKTLDFKGIVFNTEAHPIRKKL
ncbi:MAG: glycoside hydrolase family 47 protein [Pyrinomonadaceae bacterium]|nr:glycoside hydrolase family 47 protein [Pyrinomonadaceae bacterium]MBP6212428.1 glycoside hydrolase family 47 protein [Pyrinomonadaceae bacterium]